MLLTRIETVPVDAKRQTLAHGNVHIVTHSETGHHHVVTAKHVDFFMAANDPNVSFLKVKKVVQLRHLREFDTHLPLQLDPGIYRVNRQVEYIPGGFRQVQD
jgi:hypothetical protein